jgi:hypothetical protein
MLMIFIDPLTHKLTKTLISINLKRIKSLGLISKNLTQLMLI